MALQVGANAAFTVAEADALLADRIGTEEWFQADETLKGQCIVTATSMIELLTFRGQVVSDSLWLSMPRYGSYFDPSKGRMMSLDSEVAMERWRKATAILSFHLFQNRDVLERTGGVGSLEMPGLKLDSISNAPTIPHEVRRILGPMLQSSGSNWWRAN